MQAQNEIPPELFAVLDRLAAIGRQQREAAERSRQQTAGQEVAEGQTTAEGKTLNDNLKPIDSKGS